MRSAVSFPVLLLIVAFGCGKTISTPTTAYQEGTGLPATSSIPTTLQTSTTPTKTDAVPTKTNPVNDLVAAKITAFQLFEEVKKDGNWLMTKYGGQVVELTGVVNDVKVSYGNDSILFLAASNDKYPLAKEVNCPLKRGINPYSKALPGQTVVLRGAVPKDAYVREPFYWEVISATGDGPPVRTLDALIQEYKSDTDFSAINEKNQYARFIVTGEIAEVEFDETRNKNVARITIGKKDGSVIISCSFVPAGDSESVRDLRKSICKAGVKVRVLGEYSSSSKTSFSLRGCVIIDPLK